MEAMSVEEQISYNEIMFFKILFDRCIPKKGFSEKKLCKDLP